MKTIYFIRHAQAEGQPREARLTKKGEEQAQQLAEFLNDKQIDCIYSSPFERALSTIQPFAALQGLEVKKDKRLEERVLSSNMHPDWKEMLRLSFEDFTLVYDGGESCGSGFERAGSILDEAITGKSENIVFVTHGNLMTLLLRHIDSCFGVTELFSLTNPDVYEINIDETGRQWKRIWLQ
ncbi:histidine phosphatase family protein [Heyndrickxia acidicola]|uniref:Histidine phosphatase family protein n=1 Tax=Heyndrickxia acidicola TaxID=209389 RepID=A0ABU6MQC1_9BACI|nr:histidine phosphatase family protein [Heyndrickxia acidicola]MED1205245.1 histidine phosphatase family protein [Heyndrickxia acidicola]